MQLTTTVATTTTTTASATTATAAVATTSATTTVAGHLGELWWDFGLGLGQNANQFTGVPDLSAMIKWYRSS